MLSRWEGQRSEAGDFLLSENWKWVLLNGFLPTYRSWIRQVLFDQNMTDQARNGKIIAIAAYKKGITSIYEELKCQLPSWLEKELNVINGT
jgi:hypothetical protein